MFAAKSKRFITCLAIGLAARPAAAQMEIGAPVKAIGSVSLARGASSGPLRLSQPLYPADVVITGERSYTRIGFRSRWFADIPAQAEADLAWSPEPDTIYVTVGAIRGMSRPGASRFKVRSGIAEAIATGTTFYFSVAPSGATAVLVDYGEVRFANRAGDTVTVTAGLASTVRAAGLPPTPPAPPPPALVQEAADLTTRAALETQPAEAIPPESFQRLRGLREASRGALERTPAQRGTADSFTPTPDAEGGGSQWANWLMGGLAALGFVAIIAGVLITGDDDDHDDDRPPRRNRSDDQADDVIE